LRVEDDLASRHLSDDALLLLKPTTEELSHSFCIGNHHLATLHDGDY